MAVRNLATASNRNLTDKGPWEKPGEFAESSVFAPDGRALAYAWFDGKRYYELRVISLENPDNTTVLDQGDWIEPYAWSADGKWIAALVWHRDQKNEIKLISSDGKSKRVLKSFGSAEPEIAGFSPDSRYLVYSVSSGRDRERDIFIVDLNNGAERVLLRHPADDVGLAWRPDGSGLLFSSDRRGSKDVWLLPISEGMSAKAPVFIKSDFGVSRPIGMTKSGAFY